MDTDFQDLLQDAEQLTAQIDHESIGMPRFQRTISQLCEVGRRKLAKTNYQTSDSNEVNASILLAGKGIDAPRLTQTIESLKAPQVVPQKQFVEAIKDTDINSFLKSEKEAALMSTIEEIRRKTMNDMEESFWSLSEHEWDKQKQKIMSALQGTASTEFLNITQDISSLRNQSMMTGGRSAMNDVEMAFAKEVYVYNNKIISNEQVPNLAERFLEVAQKLNDKNIEEIWAMLNYMSSNLPEQLEPHAAERQSENMQKAFVGQAIRYLENGFKEFIKNTINSNLERAKVGGIPGTYQVVSGYLRLNTAKYFTSYEELYNDQPLWAIIYLCMRCGDFEAARTVAGKSKKDDLFAYIDEYIRNNGQLSPSSENKIKLDYKSKVKRSQDAFKRVVYRLLSRLSSGDNDLNEVLDNVDDFLWFQLSTCTMQSSVDHQTYQEFQCKMSIEYGEAYFTKAKNPFPYLEVLLLTSQFELAIEFLLKFDNMIAHAVHLAIALFERRLLNMSKSSYAQLISSETSDHKCVKRINFPSLIKMYTRKFEVTDPREALEYYFFLRNLKTPQNDNYFALYISELALETREFDLLFGRLEKSGVRKSGAIDKFMPKDSDKIIALVAHEIENKGLVEDAIKLYDLSRQFQRVLELCNKLLSQVVCEQNVPGSNRDRYKQMAMSIAQRYKNEANSIAILKSTSNTFFILIDLMTFFELYHAENWDLAYDTLNRLTVLPNDSDNIDSKVKQFIAYSEEIKRNFPDLILAAMNIIVALYTSINKSSPIPFGISNKISGSPFGNNLSSNDSTRRSTISQLREHAKALIKFVGCLPYRLPGDTNARLLQLEVMLN